MEEYTQSVGFIGIVKGTRVRIEGSEWGRALVGAGNVSCVGRRKVTRRTASFWDCESDTLTVV